MPPKRPTRPPGGKSVRKPLGGQPKVRPPSLQEVYVRSCAEMGLRPNSAFTSLLPDRSGVEYTAATVDLSRNYVGDKGIAPILSTLEKMPNLRALILSENGLRNNGVGLVCASASRLPHLEFIELSDNFISEGAAKALVALIEEHRQIQEVVFENTKIPVQWRVKLVDALAANRTNALAKTSVAVNTFRLESLLPTMLPKVVRLEAAISPAHQNVFSCLLSVVEENKLKATLRVAGGWVRDMLLGLHSNDIDIAIETHADAEPVTGELFAHRIAEYQQAHGDRGHTVSVIRANPALSKHIETATVRVHEIPVEFCALRTDLYTDGSRIPEVRPATPLEDAQRRDFTINTLFYNLHTGMVEDYTTGLADLRRRVIRCPLEPRTTFTDDPLRLLRGVRFVGQLGALDFVLDNSVIGCVDDALLEVLQQKVSRERVGKEFVKMMSAAHPERCIALLREMRILQHILLASVVMRQVPGKKQLSNDIERVDKLVELFPDGAARLEEVMRLSSVGLPFLMEIGVLPELSEEQRVEVALFYLVLPFFRSATESVEGTLRNVCINGLKLPVASCDCVRRLIDAYNVLHSRSLALSELSAVTLSDETVRKVFDALYILGDKHVFPRAVQVVLLAYLLMEGPAIQPEAVTSAFAGVWGGVAAQPLLLTAFDLKLPINGKELQKAYGIPPKNVGATLLRMRLKLVLCPQMTPDDLAQWLRDGASV